MCVPFGIVLPWLVNIYFPSDEVGSFEPMGYLFLMELFLLYGMVVVITGTILDGRQKCRERHFKASVNIILLLVSIAFIFFNKAARFNILSKHCPDQEKLKKLLMDDINPLITIVLLHFLLTPRQFLWTKTYLYSWEYLIFSTS